MLVELGVEQAHPGQVVTRHRLGGHVEEPLDAGDLEYVKGRIEKHVEYTDSTRGRAILDGWKTEQSRFVKVMPTDYKRAIAELRKLAEQEQQEARQQEVKVHG